MRYKIDMVQHDEKNSEQGTFDFAMRVTVREYTPEEIAEKTGEELITLGKAKSLLTQAYESKMSTFFSVTFAKRTPPYAHRTYKGCRFGVKKHFKTEKGEPAYDFVKHDLLPVWVSDKHEVTKIDEIGNETTEKVAEGYKVINMRGLVAFTLRGKHYRVKSGE